MLPRTIAARIQLVFVALLAVAMAAQGFAMIHSLEQQAFNQAWSLLEDTAHLLADHVATRSPPAPTHMRVTVIDLAGRVTSDTHTQADRLENHLNRPEFQAALRGETGRSIRPSSTVGETMMYLAVPTRLDDGTVVGALRVAMSTGYVSASVATIQQVLLGGLLLASLVVLLVARRISQSLFRPLEDLQARLRADDEQALPETGPAEVAALARALNHSREQVRRHYAELGQEHRRLERILLGLEEGVVVGDAEGRVRLANPAALRLLDVSADALESGGPEIRSEAGRRVLAALESEGDVREAWDDETNDRHLVLRTFDIAGDVGRLARVTVITDVSEFKRLDRIRREFVANASHELRTPVTALGALLEALELGAKDDPEQRDVFIERAIRQAERLRTLAEDLLDLSHAEEKERIAEGPPEYTDAVRIVRELVEAFDAASTARQHTLHVDVPDHPVWVGVSGQDLSRAVGNALENAIKYTPPGGRIELSIQLQSEQAHVTVSDNGPGIPEPHRVRVFERFYRVDKARSRALGGSGLGLAITKHLVERSGGSIAAETPEGGGTRIRIRLPHVPDEPPA